MSNEESFDFDWLDLIDTENASPWVRPDRIWLKNRPSQIAKTVKYPKLAGFHSFLKRSEFYFPNNVLLHFPQTNEKYTFYETKYNADILSNAFIKEFGIKKGDGIAIMTPNCPEFVFSVFASGQTGGTLIPVNPLLKKKEVKHIVDSAGIVKVFVTDKQYYGIVKRACKEPNIEHIVKITSDKPDDLTIQKLLESYPPEAPELKIDVNEDIAGLLFTGGTTGLPKGVMITHSNLISNCFQYICTGSIETSYEEGIEEFGKGRTVTVNPLCHAMGFYILNLCVLAAITLIIFTSFDAGGVLRMLEKYRIKAFTSVPTAYNFIINHPDFKTRDLSALEASGSGSAPLPFKIAKVWEERTGLKVANAYGLTEVTCICHGPIDWAGEMNPQSIGFPVLDTDAKIVDPPDYLTELKPGERGELLIRGPQVMKGYWKNPEATKNTLVEDENGNLWLRTGDVAIMDENGYFFIVGRTKEQIKYKGYRVLPAEVEDGLYEHPAVMDCGVIGVPHEEAGETIKAFIKLKPAYEGKVTEQEIMDWAKENMAGYKWPRMVEFVSSIPKTPVGKTMRRALLEK